MNPLHTLLASIALALSPACFASTFEVAGDQFHLDGQAFQIRSGEMHYPRIPVAEWDERGQNAMQSVVDSRL